MTASIRPVVAFDVDNIEHRKIVRQFLQTLSWQHSPVLFKTDELLLTPRLSLIDDLKTRLLAYYQDQEFS